VFLDVVWYSQGNSRHGAHKWKAQELKTGFIRGTVRRLAEVWNEEAWMEQHVVSGDQINMTEYW